MAGLAKGARCCAGPKVGAFPGRSLHRTVSGQSHTMDILTYNRHAWDRQAEKGNRWTVPVGPEVIAAARRGDWQVVLTPTKSVPRGWFPALVGLDVL